MSIPRYGLLVAQIVEGRRATGSFTCYQLLVQTPTSGEFYQVDINVRAQDGSEVLYVVSEPFQNALTDELLNGTQDGLNPPESTPSALSIDYLRGHFLAAQGKTRLGRETPPQEELNELLDGYIQRAVQTEGARLFAFGQCFNAGMHQDSLGRWEGDAEGYHYGSLMIYYPGEGWVAVFMAFPVQAFHTNAANDENTSAAAA